MKNDDNDKKLNVEKIDDNFNNNNKCEHDNNKSNTQLENDNLSMQDDLVQKLHTTSNYAENHRTKINNFVKSDCKVAPAKRSVAKKFKQVYKDLTKQIDVNAPLMLRSKKVIQPSHSQAKSKISNNAEQTKDLDWKEHETENPEETKSEDQKNWKKGIPVPLDYTEEQ
jgi:hypothetical protein